jgi:uncharacterized protein (TIRG00374 family)
MEILTLAGCLVGIVLNHAFGFFLAAGGVSFAAALRLCCTAQGLNKLLFTGTGYVLSAYFSRDAAIKASKAMAIFIILEVVFFSLWIAGGLYFGATLLAAHAQLWAAAAALLAAAAAVFFKRKRARQYLSEISSHLGEMGWRLLLVVPLALVNLGLSLVYYSALFELMGQSLPPVSVLRVVSIAISMGYLSPAPGGLGVKDVGMAAVLMEQGVPLEAAAAIACIDRVLTTGFWASLGLIFGFRLFKQEIACRVHRRSGTPRSF